LHLLQKTLLSGPAHLDVDIQIAHEEFLTRGGESEAAPLGASHAMIREPRGGINR